MDRTLAGLYMAAVQQGADMFRKVEKLVVFGSGGNLLVGEGVQHKLMKIGVGIFVYEDSYSAIQQTRKATSRNKF